MAWSKAVDKVKLGLFKAYLYLYPFIVFLSIYGSILEVHAEVKAELYPEVIKVTRLGNPGTGGTGFLIQTKEGLRVLTNGHVCKSLSNNVAVGFFSTLEARLLFVEKISRRSDLCLLSGVYDRRALDLSSSFNPTGKVKVVGYPGLRLLTITEGPTFTSSIVITSDVNLAPTCQQNGWFLDASKKCVHAQNAWFTLAKIDHGSSGSPVLNSRGEVVGIIFAFDLKEKYGIYISVNEIKEFIK